MLKKIPIVGCPIGFKDLSSGLSSLFKNTSQIEFSSTILGFLNSKYVCFTNSGTSSFYAILNVLKERCDKKEVILPAYTASSLVTAINRADLKPVLCDISSDDFSMDLNSVFDVVSGKTLCILGVHMFGIVKKGLGTLRGRFPDIPIVEDCAQSLGSKINGVSVGSLADVSFFSFNRGKNLPTYGGGCIVTNSTELGEKIKETVSGGHLAVSGLGERVEIALKILALSVLVRPWIYGILYPFILRFKEVAPPKDFEVKEYTKFQAAIVLSLLGRIDEFSKKRYHNGLRLIEGLKDTDGIILPKVSHNTEPAFNRLPVVFEDLKKRKTVEANLWKAGIETSRMYIKPLHHIFDLGYKKDAFPNATYFAEHLLTLPTHPLLRESDLETILRVIRNA